MRPFCGGGLRSLRCIFASRFPRAENVLPKSHGCSPYLDTTIRGPYEFQVTAGSSASYSRPLPNGPAKRLRVIDPCAIFDPSAFLGLDAYVE
jgi:hypothetical protein